MFIKKQCHPAHLFIISAPSGAGKSSLIKAYLAEKTTLAKVAISHTTRKPRPEEHDGEHYFFVSSDQFETMIQQNDFIEHARVFHHYYGTSRKEIEGCLEQGMDIFLDIDWQGARQVRKTMPEAKSIFILPPSLSELERRLIYRGQDVAATIQKRMQKAQSEMSHYIEYDYVIINDEFKSSIAQLNNIIQSQKLTVTYQRFSHAQLLIELGLKLA